MPRQAKPWFRLYSDILDNLKVKKLKPAQRWQWVELMALANINVPRGVLPDLEVVAFRLRVSEAVASALITDLAAKNFIGVMAGHYVMHDWDEWQADRDVTPARRSDNVTPTPGINHANVTPTSREGHARVEESRGDKEERRKEENRADPIDAVAADFATFGKVTAGTAQAIAYAVKDFSLEWVQLAVRRAAASGAEDKPPWSYVESILERWKEQGQPDEPKPRANGHKVSTSRGVAPERDYAGAAERMEARLAGR